MKKWIALLLTAVVVLCCATGCGSKEQAPEETGVEWMPYGLKFGMTYAEAKEAHAHLPAIEPAEYNDGYACGLEYIEPEFAKEYFGTPEGEDDMWSSLDPALAYSFNQDKELYEFYVWTRPQSEGKAETVCNHLYRFYQDLIQGEATETETDTYLKAEWKKDGVMVDVTLDMSGSSPLVTVVIHDTNHDLDAQ